MRLFHVSEESNIEFFEPRIPTRTDLDQTKGLVWAINEECLPNFLTPRNCPRVCYHVGPNTSEADKRTYFSSKSCPYVVAIEHKWFEVMQNTTLYLYEFNTLEFTLLDENAGYFISDKKQIPINKIKIDNLFTALFKRNIELRLVDSLWDLHEKIQKTTLNWSMCRMGFAQKMELGGIKMEFRKVKREFKLVGMKNRGFFANFGKEVPIFAHQLLKRADEIKNHTATEIALYEPKRAADHIEGNYYVGLIVNGASNEIPSGMELIEITHDYMTVRGRISDIADLHSKLSNWGEQQGYKRNLESYIIETYHPIENSEEEVEIYLPIYS
ncbi:GyrI-like domain-containing protein [Psychrobacillus lasiicapitis]|nr:GyrI-like domain-containing protein [Psychrobacillus lasiicapitis]GGA28979.1 hypothetical protein GCM10011384_18060 [Psychrobacillus lasiicapitis]